MQTGPVARDRLFNMRLSEDEAARLERLATHYGLNAAGVIRMLLKREDDLIRATAGSATTARKATTKQKR